MSRGKPVYLENGTEFNTKSKCIEYFQNILNNNTEIKQDNPNFSDVICLYTRHPEFEQKSLDKDNIEYFKIKNSGEYNTICFHAIHIDGSETDWSYKIAIDGENRSNFHNLVDGCRKALELEEKYFRDRSFSLKIEEFIAIKSCTKENFPFNDWVFPPQNSQYRAYLQEPFKTEFLTWYKGL